MPSSNCAQATNTWQSMDIMFYAATWSGTTKTANARVTVVCNGVTVQTTVQIAGSTGSGQVENANPGPVLMQNHGDPVRYRNIWVEPLP